MQFSQYKLLPKLSGSLLIIFAVVVAYMVMSIFFEAQVQPELTVLAAVLAFTFAVDHSFQRLGFRNALLLLGIIFFISLGFECVGVATGWVYGSYTYTDRLGVKFLNLVPFMVPVAWFMMSYPSLIIATRILPALANVWGWRLALAALGAGIMTAWDLALDPLMASAQYWVWEEQGAYFGIPLQNFWGWWLTTFVILILYLGLGRVTPANLATADPRFERQAILSYAITGLGTIVANMQMGQNGPALAGLAAMSPWAILAYHSARTSPKAPPAKPFSAR